MNINALLPEIQTGDYALFRGHSVMSAGIEWLAKVTDSKWVSKFGVYSHIAKFFWEQGQLNVAEMWDVGGYRDLRAVARLKEYDGLCFFAPAPHIVRDNPMGTFFMINEFRITPALQHYGNSTLGLVALSDLTNIHIHPDSVQSVCSGFCQHCDEACGMTFDRLFAPSDYLAIIDKVVPIEL
jgi:hypothetical protein